MGSGEPVAPEVMASRVQYLAGGLDLDTIESTPLEQFRQWFAGAVGRKIPEPNAMALATAGPSGPSVRTVLAKSVDAEGVRFFTNLESAKARDILADPRVAICFTWIEVHRQVRFAGVAELLGADEVSHYFHSRPRGAQIGAWASPQSAVIESRQALRDRVRQVESTIGFDEEIAVPPHWGGYLVRPSSIEFWQGQPSRLHDRLEYVAEQPGARLDDPEGWSLQRLAP